MSDATEQMWTRRHLRWRTCWLIYFTLAHAMNIRLYCYLNRLSDIYNLNVALILYKGNYRFQSYSHRFGASFTHYPIEAFSVRNQNTDCALVWVTIARSSESEHQSYLVGRFARIRTGQWFSPKVGKLGDYWLKNHSVVFIEGWSWENVGHPVFSLKIAFYRFKPRSQMLIFLVVYSSIYCSLDQYLLFYSIWLMNLMPKSLSLAMRATSFKRQWPN